MAQEIIRKKRHGHELSAAELKDFFAGYLAGRIADYQASALLMACFLKGMTKSETSTLTRIMRDSGRVMQWEGDHKNVVDKHSTGGVGDKTSLVLLPLCVLEGVRVPMMSGRGLGHTGGTLDKLESIPGIRVRITADETKSLVSQFGGAFIGQSGDLAPLDQKLYALRDVTATVESIPLITASILSKKLAEGLGGLVLDIKVGSGAFMETTEAATALAHSLIEVARQCDLKARCLLTNMDTPLGKSAGNTLEVLECIEILRGEGPKDTTDLSVRLAAEMINLATPGRSQESIELALRQHLSSGSAFERFCAIIAAQGGDTTFLRAPDKFKRAAIQKPVIANAPGRTHVAKIDVRKLGLAIVELGGGRRLLTDNIDHAVGLSEMAHVGDNLSSDQPVAIIHGNDPHKVSRAAELVAAAYELSDSPCQAAPLLLETIG